MPVEPFVKEPFAAIPGRVPRRVAIDRKKKLFQSYTIKDLLRQEGIEFKKISNEWLPLTMFDNTEYD